jgi:hypothetical protein
MHVDRIIVTIDGDLTSVVDIVGSIRIYRKDIQCLNNFVMDIIIICPEAVIQYVWGQDVDRFLKLGNFASTT